MSNQEESFEQIQAHRAQIDAIDKQLVELLNERAKHQLAIRAAKPNAHMALYDPKREEEIFMRVEKYNQGPLYPDNLREIYAAILKVSKEVPSA